MIHKEFPRNGRRPFEELYRRWVKGEGQSPEVAGKWDMFEGNNGVVAIFIAQI